MNHNTFWKLLLVSRLLIIIVGLNTLNNIAVNISSDGILNRPQKESSIDYPHETANQIIILVVLSTTVAFFSIFKFFQSTR
jgi:hypothetical protein